MVFVPPRKERVVLYVAKAGDLSPYYHQMKEHIARNYYWSELIEEVHGRENLARLYHLAVEREFDLLMIEDLKDLGPTSASRLSTAASLAMNNVKVEAWNGLSYHDVPLDSVRRLTIGLLAPNVAYPAYERTKERYGRALQTRKGRRKKRCDVGLPKKKSDRTPEQQAWVDAQIATRAAERKDGWIKTKERWVAERAQQKEARRIAREEKRKKAETPIDGDAN